MPWVDSVSATLVTWYAGVFLGSEFTSGLGVGVLVSALALRILRGRADAEDHGVSQE